MKIIDEKTVVDITFYSKSLVSFLHLWKILIQIKWKKSINLKFSIINHDKYYNIIFIYFINHINFEIFFLLELLIWMKKIIYIYMCVHAYVHVYLIRIFCILILILLILIITTRKILLLQFHLLITKYLFIHLS